MGPQTRFLNNPRYQRALQIYSRFDPTRKAIMDTVIADKHFADEEMRNKLMLLKMGYERERGRKEHKLAEEKFEADIGLRSRGMDIEERGIGIEKGYRDYLSDRADLANMLGWGNIGVSGLRGLVDLRDKQQYTNWLKQMANTYRR